MGQYQVYKSYLGLVIIIILWVAIWSVSDLLARIYLSEFNQKVVFMFGVIFISSFILIRWFPEQLTHI